MMQRWLVIAVEGGGVENIFPFTKLLPAQRKANEIGDSDDKELDYVIVWDLALNKIVYGPF